MEYWTEGNQIIVITADNLLFGDYAQKEILEFTNQLDKGIIPNQLKGIPLNYIRNIQIDDRKKRMDIELGKRSTDKIDFKSRRTMNSVFNYIKDNIKVFILAKPSSSEIWERYIKMLFFIGVALVLLFSVTKSTGSSAKSKVLSMVIGTVSEALDNVTIILIGLSLIIWRTIILILDLKARAKTLRLTRK